MKPDLHFRWIALVLRWGAYGSALLLATGIAWLLFEPDIPMQIGPPIPFGDLPAQLLQANPYALLQIAVLLLLVTPPLSTVMAGIEGAVSRHYTQAALCFGLIAAIVTGFLLGLIR